MSQGDPGRGQKKKRVSRDSRSLPPAPETPSVIWFLQLLRDSRQHILANPPVYLRTVEKAGHPFEQEITNSVAMDHILPIGTALDSLKETFNTARCKAQLSLWKSLYLSTSPNVGPVRAVFLQWLKEGDTSQVTDAWRAELFKIVPELTETPLERTPQGKLVNTAGRRIKSWKRILQERPDFLYELRELAILPHPMRHVPENLERLLAYFELLTTISPDGAVCRNENDQVFLVSKLLHQLPIILRLPSAIAELTGGLLLGQRPADRVDFGPHMAVLHQLKDLPLRNTEGTRLNRATSHDSAPQPPRTSDPERPKGGRPSLDSAQQQAAASTWDRLPRKPRTSNPEIWRPSTASPSPRSTGGPVSPHNSPPTIHRPRVQQARMSSESQSQNQQQIYHMRRAIPNRISAPLPPIGFMLSDSDDQFEGRHSAPDLPSSSSLFSTPAALQGVPVDPPRHQSTGYQLF